MSFCYGFFFFNGTTNKTMHAKYPIPEHCSIARANSGSVHRYFHIFRFDLSSDIMSLHIGDKILEVNGTPVRDQPIENIENLMRNSNSVLQVSEWFPCQWLSPKIKALVFWIYFDVVFVNIYLWLVPWLDSPLYIPIVVVSRPVNTIKMILAYTNWYDDGLNSYIVRG